jgi:ABC-type cobalamin/Fe3+-siderophores transport system ATPase subunit
VSAYLEVRDLVVRRGPRTVLDGVSLDVRSGDALALVGPNAAGKSTLVRTLAGILPAVRGEVVLDARPLASWSRDAVARRVALVAPEDEGPPMLTVADRVRLGRYPHRGPFRPLTDEDEAAVRRALELTGIEHLAGRRLGELSAGERQLVLLARGLAQQPRLLLLDEPAAHLDVGHQLALFRALDEVRERGVAVLAVVHDLPRAAEWARRMVLLHGGRIAAEGSPDAVLGSPAAEAAFAVRIRGLDLAGGKGRVYRFEEHREEAE